MDPNSKEQAKRWVEQAIAFYKMSGKRIALAAFTDPSGIFVKDELYIFVMNAAGTMLAHGINERFVGEDFIELRDSEGRYFIKEIIDTANSKRKGWVEYKWHHPVLRQWLPKITYFEKVDNIVVCSGIYEI